MTRLTKTFLYTPVNSDTCKTDLAGTVSPPEETEEIKVSVKSIREVLSIPELHIPDYQRPYKWERRHIRNLFYDVREMVAQKKGEYRLGSIILHKKNKDEIDIVDGQQRLISISLFLHFRNNNIPGGVPQGVKKLLGAEYIGISQQHAKENYTEWMNLCNSVCEKEAQTIESFIKGNCTVAVIEMPANRLSEAFQLFDSQNNRGKALKPHDLLKAYHLRAIKNPDEKTIEKWEEYAGKKRTKDGDSGLNLEVLFDKHLFRVRRWVNGQPGLRKKKSRSELRFSEHFIDDFKGVNLDEEEVEKYPYLKLYSALRAVKIKFPNSLCMPIINGEAFFKFVEYSYELFNKSYMEKENTSSAFGFGDLGSERIREYITSKKNKYARNINLFDNLIASFIDRFGEDKLDNEICGKVFVWAFYLRVKSKAVYDSSLANYASGTIFQKKPNGCQGLFRELIISSTPREFLTRINTDLFENKTAEDIIKDLEDTEGKK